MSDSRTFNPIPIASAKALAEQFGKNIVIIIDRDHRGATGTTTWGRSSWDKEQAAAAAERCMRALGRDLGTVVVHEDFHRDYDPARLREAEELLGIIFDRKSLDVATIDRIKEFLDRAGIPEHRSPK
jgi:hypothetical protein